MSFVFFGSSLLFCFTCSLFFLLKGNWSDHSYRGRSLVAMDQRGNPAQMSVQSPAGLVSASAVWLCPRHDGVAPSSSPIIRISTGVGKMGHGSEVYIWN